VCVKDVCMSVCVVVLSGCIHLCARKGMYREDECANVYIFALIEYDMYTLTCEAFVKLCMHVYMRVWIHVCSV